MLNMQFDAAKGLVWSIKLPKINNIEHPNIRILPNKLKFEYPNLSKLANIRKSNIRTFVNKRTSNICHVQCQRIFELRTFEYFNGREHPNIQTFEHLDIGEHSNIEHFNVQKIVNITEHLNMIVRRSVAPAWNH